MHSLDVTMAFGAVETRADDSTPLMRREEEPPSQGVGMPLAVILRRECRLLLVHLDGGRRSLLRRERSGGQRMVALRPGHRLYHMIIPAATSTRTLTYGKSWTRGWTCSLILLSFLMRATNKVPMYRFPRCRWELARAVARSGGCHAVWDNRVHIVINHRVWD